MILIGRYGALLDSLTLKGRSYQQGVSNIWVPGGGKG